ncbi:MAG: divalent-cation tolerance protein CutA [Sphingomonadales bacterium]|jgi:periplasmic divalent cation tolerance protein|nr:divalent-cation tolerance protein CutA [Sphingomonadales bacterium]MBK9004949.1 divalent-cation tolerance protein CutA [Sphingomonadales bacterium]MBK9267318.1 divalent-cation tolerance protein CutA [Sphingomonadales bacterium]MBP6434005.1 divalent-cation tolerance protein CutA [Sphingorhabdus sp.]
MAELAIVYAVFPSAGEAHDCCRNLLQERLVACANRLAPVISHYRWEGEIETSEEHPVILKTALARQQEVIDRIAQLHRHKVPAILAWPAAAAHPAFALWVNSETCA